MGSMNLAVHLLLPSEPCKARAGFIAAQAVRRNRGNLSKDLPRIEKVTEPDSLNCPCGCGEMRRIGEDPTERLTRSLRKGGAPVTVAHC